MERAVFLLIVLSSFVMSSQEEESYLMNVSELTIKPGHDQQFTEGVKRYITCYRENQGEDSWNMWRRVHGAGNVYVLTSTMENWAEMDEDQEEEAVSQCRNIIMEYVWPHIESSTYSIARSMPEISQPPSGDMKLVWVTFFDVNNTLQFREVIDEVSSTISEEQGQPMGVWYSYAGGAPNAPNYMVSMPFENFAALDMERNGPWEIMEKKHGKAKVAEIRDKMRNSVDQVWSYLYQFKDDLSMRQ